MNLLVFSLIIGVTISLTYNYFSFEKFKTLTVPFLIDVTIISTLTYISVSVLNKYEQNIFIFLAFLFGSFCLYLFYLLKIRDSIFLKHISKNRVLDIENYFFNKYDKKIEIYTNDKINKIKILQGKRQVIIPTNIMSNMEPNQISNIIALNFNKSIMFEISFVVVYFIPALIFYYSITYTSGNIKTMLILFASALIFIIRRFFSENRTSLNVKNLKNIVDKQELIESVKKYHLSISANLLNLQKTINEHKMNKSIETINKLL
jgi:hypothetical protein